MNWQRKDKKLTFHYITKTESFFKIRETALDTPNAYRNCKQTRQAIIEVIETWFKQKTQIPALIIISLSLTGFDKHKTSGLKDADDDPFLQCHTPCTPVKPLFSIHRA